jgi:hypothetical protein
LKFFWSYPKRNLTLIIETPFTQKQQTYAIRVNIGAIQPSISHIYRLLEDQETEVIFHDDTFTEKSDSNYQVVLKFEGPPTLQYYGVFINYNITQI